MIRAYSSTILKSPIMISPPSARICAPGCTIHPSPNVTLPFITASWQNTLFGAPPRADTWPRADERPVVVRPSPLADVLPDGSPLPDVRPLVSLAAAPARADSISVLGFSRVVLASSVSGTSIYRPARAENLPVPGGPSTIIFN